MRSSNNKVQKAKATLMKEVTEPIQSEENRIEKRQGGAPKKGKSNRRHPVSVYLTTEEKEKLDTLLKERYQTASSYLRRLLDKEGTFNSD